MFTGLIEEVGYLLRSHRAGSSYCLQIRCRRVLEGARVGDSIAVNGTCLTLVEVGGDYFAADVGPETMRNTNLGYLKSGEAVNLERALRLGDRLGGHLVTGHIDGVGVIKEKKREKNAVVIEIEAPPVVMKYVVPRGSVAVDGVSLTVVQPSAHSFSVSIIPHTARATTLTAKPVGSKVNLEADLIGKYVAEMVTRQLGGKSPPAVPQNPRDEGTTLDLGFLVEKGFA